MEAGHWMDYKISNGNTLTQWGTQGIILSSCDVRDCAIIIGGGGVLKSKGVALEVKCL